jgi:xanthine dehydrogenase accessory factor
MAKMNGEKAESIQTLYARLMEELALGREAAVVSRYVFGGSGGPDGPDSPGETAGERPRAAGDGVTRGGIVEKLLYSKGNAAAWSELSAILENPGVVCDGPIAYSEGATAASDGGAADMTDTNAGSGAADATAGDNAATTTAGVTDDAVSRMRPFSLLAVERYLPKPRMLILGGGHIALALTKMAKLTDFYVTVFDDRPAFANPGRFPEADEVICDDFSRVMERVKVRSSDYVVIVTRGHKHDTECLEGVLSGVRPAYTGMVGSRRRVAIVMKQLADAGYDQKLLDDVYSPIGLRISAVTPAEISVSILAEIIGVKREGFNIKGARAAAAHGSEIKLTCDIEIAEWLARHGDEADALLTRLTTKGPVPRETGAKMAISYEGRTAGTIGGGCAESDVMQDARTIIREGGWMTKTVDMADSAEDDGMVCGGTMSVIIERVKRV